MKLSKSKGSKMPQLPMEPLVDCVFLLLIFFMISNILKIPPPFTVDLPESKARSEFARKRYNVYIHESGQVSVDDVRMADLDAMFNYLLLKKKEIETLIIRADKNAEHGVVVDVMERAKQAEIDNLALAISEDDYKGM
ncbi:biopolymer transporter ExbD [Candidatus Poribacteria bacterium]|nr:biopolymer transporter ExbD [Candidatus Poribacteria bacterium]MBT5536853.1 biopolymer transporter ExbD [Candidatus Poribacteria bacterium]MBT5713301.1 biopolymer transporter ExbD [Candidatus Poribacteria bacterium]MBT7099425.1 biopolymer transporter ExbD [Candidatus Poribacteria bacterium]MBT7804287.1 biopolymer transporter ExbD [Candidatus Poribacteria bacterium]